MARELNVQPGFVKLTKPIQGWWIRSRSEELTKKEGSPKQTYGEAQDIQPKQAEPKQSDSVHENTGFKSSDIKEDYVTREQRNPQPQSVEVAEEVQVENAQERSTKTLQNEEEEVDKDEVA